MNELAIYQKLLLNLESGISLEMACTQLRYDIAELQKASGEEITVREALEKFTKGHGNPDLVVGPLSFKFPLQDLLRGSDITLFLLPQMVWEWNKLYMENILTRQVTLIKR